MFLRIKSTPNSPYKAVQIVESVRDGDKVRQKIVRHVGTAIDEDELIKLKNLAEYIKIKLKTQHQGSLFSPELTVKEIIENKDKSDQTRKEPLHTDLKHMKSNA